MMGLDAASLGGCVIAYVAPNFLMEICQHRSSFPRCACVARWGIYLRFRRQIHAHFLRKKEGRIFVLTTDNTDFHG